MKKAFRIIGLILLALIVLHLLTTNITHIILRTYIDSFDDVDYKDQLEPRIGREGFYTFTTDRDFKVMQLNDLHICGGFASIKRDKAAISQVMTMVSLEKPDLVVLNGDSVFCVPYPIFRGGMTFNNRMTSKLILEMFEELETYFTVTFGNHDTESFDFTSRKNLGKLYSKKRYEYCLFNSDFKDYGVSNQIILVKNSKGQIVKSLVLLDSNAYINNSLKATINWQYDTIHDEQIQWAKKNLSELANYSVSQKALLFFHIPIGEFVTAYRDLESNNFKDTLATQFINGFWNEQTDPDMGERIWYGGCCQTEKDPKDTDNLFEVLGPEGANLLDACFCAHDHVNTATVRYKGVILAYGNSIDNSAYKEIAKFGKQRGSMIITAKQDGSFELEHKNLYFDYDYDSRGIDLNNHYYQDIGQI